MGKCLECGAFNSVAEKKSASSRGVAAGASLRAVKISDLQITEEGPRCSTGLDFLDRVLGGGLPQATVSLVAGEPGIGKSTLLFQMMAGLKSRCLYVSAEESLSQVGSRFKKFKKDLGDQMYLLSENRISEILIQMEVLRPEVMVIDSIQMISAEEDRVKGGMAAIRDVTDLLVSRAKEMGTSLFVVGHVNKDGEIAGPKTLEHMVDVVLMFSLAEDARLRVLQTQKNRYGATGEVVLLEISDSGLHEAKDADSFWVQKHQKQVYGCAVSGVLLGSRIVCVEIQALVVNSYFPSPRRSTSGFDLNRLLLILAVLEKRLKVPFSRFDVYLNVVGGIKVQDPGADLAVAAALVSAYSEKEVPPQSVFVGEIGLTGELRPPKAYGDRLQNLSQRGHSKILGPKLSAHSSSATKFSGGIFAFSDRIEEVLKVDAAQN